MNVVLSAVLSLGGLALASAAAAQDTPVAPGDIAPAERIAMEVLNRVYSGIEDLVAVGGPLEPGDLMRLMLVAKQKAAAETCEGFAVDPARYEAVMTGALEGVAAAGEEPLQRVMASFHVGYGAELALAAFDRAAYCAMAAELRGEMAGDEGDKVLVWADPS